MCFFPSFSSSSLGSCLSFSHSWRFGELTALSLNNISPLWIINRVRVCALCICIEGPSMVCKTKQQQQQKQRWITASLLGSAKNPSKSRAKMLENKAKREKKHTHTIHPMNETNAKNQHWNVVSFICTACHYAWLLVLLSSLSFFLHLFLTFLTRLCIAFAIYCIHMSVEQAKEWKKKSRTVCIFIHEKKSQYMNFYAYVLRFWLSKCISETIVFIRLCTMYIFTLSLSLTPSPVPLPTSSFVYIWTIRMTERSRKNDNKSQRKKCAFFWWS